ncbi:MAG TPA: ADOP family duplicated permease [Bryobacteraceae bacterium]|jgi:predicted permease|nr:ADOP family duplicated permease [Bryobacteraceae bacterium]
MNFAWRIYRWLAQAFPHEFNLAYGEEVMQLGEDVVREIAKRHGAAGLIRLIADIAIRVPLEYLSEMRRDMRYAWRALLKSPGFALVGIVSMGIGMGLTTNVYSSKWALLTRELPAAANAKRLVMPEKPVSYYYIERYRDQKSLFAGVAALQTGVPFNVTFGGDTNAKTERVFGQLVSPDYFSVLGVEPQRGRLLSAGLDKPGDAPVVVISDRFWRNRLNSSPNAVGQTLRVNGRPATIVGITPKNFNGALFMNPAELFVPLTAPAALAPELANDVLHRRDAKEFVALMGLAPGVTIGSAEAALDGITRRLDEQDPAAARADKAKRVTLLPAGVMVPLPENLRRMVMGFFAALMALVMAIVCMNLANMLLARGANRRKEFAIRLAVGASRFRLIRQIVSEGMLPSLLGGAAGLALAYWLSVLNSHLNLPAVVPVESDFSLDWHTAVFVFAVATVCGIGFSLAPALQVTKADVAPVLKEGSALQLPGHHRFGMRNLLIVAQVAGSLMLLLITGFLVIGITKVATIRTKFDPNTMYLLSIDPVRDGYAPESAQALFEKLPERLKAAGVRSMALAGQMPFSIEDEDGAVRVTAEDARGASRVQISAIKETVGAGYFAVLREPMLAGREFDERDQRMAARDDAAAAGGRNAVALPVILNESAARGFFGNGNAIGRRIRDEKQSYEVAGVVPDLKDGSGVIYSIIYLPLTRRDFTHPPAGGITIIVRSNARANALSGMRSVLASMDPNLILFNVQTLNEYLDRCRYATRSAVRTYGGIGVFGLVLSAIGLAGVTGYAVAQRRREVGIRMALGARKAQVLRLVLREGAALVTVGTVLGFLGTIALARILSALTNMFAESLTVGSDEPRLLVGAPLLLATLAMLACYVPARRSAKIDPLTVLRQE